MGTTYLDDSFLALFRILLYCYRTVTVASLYAHAKAYPVRFFHSRASKIRGNETGLNGSQNLSH
jgi:hypothetical protein